MSPDPTTDAARRRHSLLLAMVQEFIGTAVPVGSQQIVARYNLGVRGASVRSMMAELEEQGLLHQPHTSAGRIPTDKAFRYYVDSLASRAPIAFEDRAQIELHCSERTRDSAEIFRDTSRLLALLSGQAALVTAPRLDTVALERVSFVRVSERQVLAVFVAIAGAVHNRLIEAAHDYRQDELDRMAAYLNDSLHGRTLIEARHWLETQLREDAARYDDLRRAALTLGAALAAQRPEAEVYIEGSAQALEQPEFADRARLRELIRALEDKTALLDLLERSAARGAPTVSIGSENFDPRLSGLSVVAAPYASNSMPLGSLAILGPVRMDYGRLIPLVDYTAKALSRALEH